MHPKLSRYHTATKRNVAESRRIAEAQRAFVEQLTRDRTDTAFARELLHAAQATQAMFETHLDQLARLTRPH